MDLGLFKGIIDDASDVGVKRVRLFVNGEPMLHPQIVDMIGYIKSKGLSLTLHTNGMAFNREMSEAILRSGVTWADHITFSIMGSSKQVHEKIMRKADFDLITENLFGFIRLRNEFTVNGPVIQTIFHTMPENEHEEANYLQYWRGRADHARLGGRISRSFSEHGKEIQDIEPREKSCPYLWEMMTIFWNGDVSMCPQDVDGDRVLGNLGELSIKELWNHDQLQSIRMIHIEERFHEFPFCFRCDLP
jgi:radical SAM protein with 4Fe4S-binding SPASM domain